MNGMIISNVEFSTKSKETSSCVEDLNPGYLFV